MKKILKNRELLNQFQIDKKSLSQKQLCEKYNISQSSITRLIKALQSQNNSQISEQQSDQQSDSQTDQSQIDDQQLDQSQNEQSSKQNEQSSEQNDQSNEQNEQSNEQNDQSNQTESENEDEQSKVVNESQITIQQSEQIEDEDHQNDNSLINYLNQKQNDSISIIKKQTEKRKVIKQEPEQVIQNIQQPKPIQQIKPIQQVNIQQIDLQAQQEQDQDQIKCYMVKIRKIIQFFKDEICIHHLIGSDEYEQRQFIQRLYLKNLEEMKLIHKSLEFELLFSRSNSFIQDSIEQVARFGEKALSVVGVDVIGTYDDLQNDEEYQFYMKLLLSDSSYIPSAKQILMMKFIKSYYARFNQQKTNLQPKQNKQVDEELLSKFNKL